MSGVYAAIETAEDAIRGADDPADIAGALNDCAQSVAEVRDEYQGSLDNMPEGLQQGDTGQQIQEKVNNLDSFASELESAAGDIEGEEFEESEDIDEQHEGEADEKKKEWIEELRSRAEDALSSLQE